MTMQRSLFCRRVSYLFLGTAIVIGGFAFLAQSAHADLYLSNVEALWYMNATSTGGYSSSTTTFGAYQDASGNHHDEYDMSGTSLATGCPVFTTCAFFNGNSGYYLQTQPHYTSDNYGADADATDPILTSSTASFSVVSWFKDDAAGAGLRKLMIIQGEYATNGGLLEVWRGERGTGEWWYAMLDASGNSHKEQFATVTDSDWHLLVLNWNGSAETMTSYIDGALTDSHNFGFHRLANWDYNTPLGGRIYTNAWTWDGKIGQTAILSRILSTDEISELWNTGSGQKICVTVNCTTDPESYYAKVQGSVHHLYQSESDTSAVLKTLPPDWIIHVVSSTDNSGNPMISGGYHWFQIADPTDGVTGWMAASSSGSQYISSYDGSSTVQTNMYTSSSVQIATGTTADADLILGAIDHYYNNADTNDSLYSSDDDTGLVNGNASQNHISRLKERNYPEQLILGIAAWEDGRDPYDFDNQWMSYDYGGGIMQNTFAAWWNEPDNYADNSWDIRGYGSGVTIPPCKSVGSNLYENCYANAGTQNYNLKPYQNYGGISTNPKYLQYANTQQSIYANIKDGLKDLSQSYLVRDLANDPTGTDNRICNYTSSTVSVTYGTSTVDYSCLDREIILTTADYNGGGYGAIDQSTGSSTNYLYHVASTTLNISNFFATSTDATTTAIADKMIIANASSVYVQLHSPGDLSIQDSFGHTVGMVNGTVVNTFPFASYDARTKTAHIFFPQSNNLSYKVTGTGTGVYGLDVSITGGSQQISFHRDEIAPIVPGQVDTYTIDQNAIVNHKNGVTLKVDRKGTGKVDSIENFAGAANTFSPGNTSKIPYNLLPKTKPNNAVIAPRTLFVPIQATSTIQTPTTTLQQLIGATSTLFDNLSSSLMIASSTVSSTMEN